MQPSLSLNHSNSRRKCNKSIICLQKWVHYQFKEQFKRIKQETSIRNSFNHFIGDNENAFICQLESYHPKPSFLRFDICRIRIINYNCHLINERSKDFIFLLIWVVLEAKGVMSISTTLNNLGNMY